MHFLRNVRIAHKIGLILTFFFVLCAALTTLAAINIVRLEERTHHLVRYNAEVLSETARAQENFTAMHQLAFEMRAAGRNGADLVQEFNSERREMESRLAQIAPNVTGADRNLYAAIAREVEAYFSTFEHARAFLARGDARHFEAFLESEGIESFDRADAAFDALVTAQDRALDQSALEARAQAQSALATMLAGAVLGLFAVTALALAIVRREITSPLGAITAAMKRLTEGDYGAQVDARPRRDEIGDLIGAFEAFRYAALDRLVALAEAERQRELAETERRKSSEEQLLRVAAEESNRVKSQFLANMSHELRTPLNAILGYAEMTAEELAAADPTHVSLRDLARITTAGTHLLSLINDILDLAKIEAGAVEAHVSHVDPARLVEDVLALAQPLARKSSTELVWRAPQGLLRAIETDERRLKQCLLNLVSNACKFTKNGTVEIKVDFLGSGGEAQLQFSVIDSGIGMTRDQVDRVFNAFEQADASISRQYGGTGLGLSISRSLARMLGGDVRLESALGRGTTAILTIAARLEHQERTNAVGFTEVAA